LALDTETRPICHAVYANLQGSKKCPFFHKGAEGSPRVQGNIKQLTCPVKFHFFTPQFINETPTTNKMALVSIGEHTHPAPPPRKIPEEVKQAYSRIFREFGLSEVTARRLITSPILPMLLNGDTTLNLDHIGLTNLDSLGHLIRKERLREHPFGTDILGVQHLLTTRITDPYIRQVKQYDDGHFVILCQFEQQSELYFQCTELQADKTYPRTKCQEFEINSFDHATKRLHTLCRVWTDYEDVTGYYEAINISFKTAEKDIGKRIQWSHLTDILPGPSKYSTAIKAIVLDEAAAQVQAFGQWFEKEYGQFGNGEWHLSRILKICRVHYERSITQLHKKGVSEGIYHLLQFDWVELIGLVRYLSSIESDSYSTNCRLI